ncbi:MAG: hypothetical protein J6U19_05320 [Oscillospiraceae bacterium]|nr:hypothetical protein [Oscillospiraceae bacterium]
MRKKDRWHDLVVQIVIVILLGILGSGLWLGIEYGRYMYMAPDGMDFGTFVWIETLRR